MSNPLLLIIMLLTYRDNAEIPNKLHLFYAKAFESLYSRHDATKPGSFIREMRSGLAQDDFEKVLSAFAMLTYSERAIQFSSRQVRDYVGQAGKVAGIKVNVSDYLEDLQSAVCILVHDGSIYEYNNVPFSYIICILNVELIIAFQFHVIIPFFF